jgi:hypothetical protein
LDRTQETGTQFHCPKDAATPLPSLRHCLYYCSRVDSCALEAESLSKALTGLGSSFHRKRFDLQSFASGRISVDSGEKRAQRFNLFTISAHSKQQNSACSSSNYITENQSTCSASEASKRFCRHLSPLSQPFIPSSFTAMLIGLGSQVFSLPFSSRYIIFGFIWNVP